MTTSERHRMCLFINILLWGAAKKDWSWAVAHSESKAGLFPICRGPFVATNNQLDTLGLDRELRGHSDSERAAIRDSRCIRMLAALFLCSGQPLGDSTRIRARLGWVATSSSVATGRAS